MDVVGPSLTGLVVNLAGFATGAALYLMLIAMVWRERAAEHPTQLSRRAELPLLMGVCGLLWNLGALTAFGLPLLGLPRPSTMMVAVSFSALGALPAVVVHSLIEGRERSAGRRLAYLGIGAAYGLSIIAMGMHVAAAARGTPVPSRPALWLLTAGFLALLALLLLATRQAPVGRRGIWVAALAVFAVSAAHFGRHDGNEQWWVELIGHHASLPLALAILHQDYRFAFADLFLKNAIALLLLMGLTLAVFSGVIAPWLDDRATGGAPDPRALVLIVSLAIVTAISFPWLQRISVVLVDRAVLKRPDYSRTLGDLGARLDRADSEEAVISALTDALRTAIGASGLSKQPSTAGENEGRTVIAGPGLLALPGEPTPAALIMLHTMDPPHPVFALSPLRQGRRLLSDDLRLLEGTARLATRRLDVLRVGDERVQRSLQEQSIRQLAVEAELKALRSQLNPHFLFNALTTIGYLIRVAPPRAFDTLMRLTDVLRAVLQRSTSDDSTLADEIELVSAYLEIEKARYEDRLQVHFQVAPGLGAVCVPALILQPLVENAIKHGIAPLARGGSLTVTAAVAGDRLRLQVIDSGAGFDAARARTAGVGLANLRKRLAVRYGAAAAVVVESVAGVGTTVTVELPAERADAAVGRPAPRSVA
jgi:signal transduction histidine kinase